MRDCVFCRIINKEEDAEIVYENDYVISFYTITPTTDVHVLVVPKNHIVNILDITDNDHIYITEMHKAFIHISKLLNIDDSGFRVVTNTGKHGQQEVMHLHYHLIGGRQLKWEM